MISQKNRHMKLRRYIRLTTTRIHVWFHKTPEPVEQIVDCCTTTLSPSTTIFHLIKTIVYEIIPLTVLYKKTFFFYIWIKPLKQILILWTQQLCKARSVLTKKDARIGVY